MEDIKELEKQKRRANYLKNKDRILANNSKSRAKHRESILEGKKEYYNKIKLDVDWQERQKEYRQSRIADKKAYDARRAIINSTSVVARAKAWNRDNPAKRAIIVFNYDAKRRMATSEGDSSADILAWVIKQIKICYWCGIDCDQNYHIDHYHPLSKGGEHRVHNLVISCPYCNLSKNAKDPYEFAKTKGRLF